MMASQYLYNIKGRNPTGNHVFLKKVIDIKNIWFMSLRILNQSQFFQKKYRSNPINILYIVSYLEFIQHHNTDM